MNQLLRQLPSTTELLAEPSIQDLLQTLRHDTVVTAVRDVLDQIRHEILENQVTKTMPVEAIVQRIKATAQRFHQTTLQPVINATGILLHTGLGRSPLPKQALTAISRISEGYASVEINLDTGKRSNRASAVENKLQHLFGCEAATVVNNNAGATLLALSALADGREAIVSRGELVEIGGSFRMPDVMRTSGTQMVEVGTTNKTRASDYDQAVNQETAVLMKIHCSNYQIAGFSESATIPELAEVAAKHNLILIDDIGSGALFDYTRYGIQDEPVPTESLKHGSDVVLFSGDKLLGGPQCGIIVGRQECLDRINQHPLMRALRVDKTIYAALAATLDIYLGPDPEQHIPLLNLLQQSTETLQQRAEAMAGHLRQRLPDTFLIESIGDVTFLGGGSVPGQEISTYCVVLQHDSLSPDDLSQQLRTCETPILGRIQQNRFFIDLRTVFSEQDETIENILVGTLENTGELS